MRTGHLWLNATFAILAVIGVTYWFWPRADWSKIDAIPPHNLKAFAEAHRAGLGYMERYDYPRARVAFAKAHQLAPGLIAGSINLAIATLNDTGTQEEQKVAKGGKPELSKFDAAIALLDGVLERDKDNLHAHFCRGVILEYTANFEPARRDFLLVTERDPSDDSAWLKLGAATNDPSVPLAERKAQVKELVRIYNEALKRNPNNVVTLYKLAFAYAFDGNRDEQQRLLKEFNALDPEKKPSAPGDESRTTYGQMGKYATIIDPFGGLTPAPPDGLLPPRFDKSAPLVVTLPPGDRWVKESDFTGKLAVIGRARARFGAAIVAFDADGDEVLDLYLAAAVVGPNGVRDALLINDGEGKFTDASKAFGLPDDRASLAVAAADFDADRFTDVFASGVGDNRLYRNLKGKAFEDASKLLPPMGPPAIAVIARWMDLDQDGDLDLFVVNHAAAADAEAAFTDKPPGGLKNSAYRNDGVPTVPPKFHGVLENLFPDGVAASDAKQTGGLVPKFTAWDAPEAKALLGDDARHAGLAVLDIDDDRDLDLVVASDDGGLAVVLNDRLGRFRSVEGRGLDGPALPSGLLTADLDRDGLADLVATSASGLVSARRNLTARDSDGKVHVAFEPYPIDARGWRSAALADLDLDGSLDLLGLPAKADEPAPALAHAEARRFATSPLAVGPDSVNPAQGLAYVDLAGDPLPDLLVVRDGEGPRLAINRGNGRHWLGLKIGGRWHERPKNARTNSEGLGVRVVVEGDGLLVRYDHTTPETGPAQSVTPVVLGLGDRQKARLVRLKWPDGVLQCELDEDADRLVPLAENNRKEGSCPVLFTWDGTRMVCLGDFLGGGGLGYLVAPGVYGEPDRDEAVAIDAGQLKAVDGKYRMAIAEPMSELAYLDKITLEIVDRPPGIEAAPDERFAPGGNRPSGKLLGWRTPIAPAHATDLKGKDVLDALRHVDRIFADDFRRLLPWIGYAEEHGIVLDFGDRLAGLGPEDRVALVLVGVTEYPYSQTNYAAATAGVPLKPPVLERLAADGSWAVVEADPGYPAGMERMTTLELTGKLGGPSCVLRLRTNMDIAWDQAFVVKIEADPGLRVTKLSVSRSILSHRGYIREASPDGRLPLIYDYEYVDPAPLANLAGRLTKFGDVSPLLRDDDDELCVVGPGDEVRLEFDARRAPDLLKGWTRSFILRTIGYCKDADPFTAASDAVGPLPWKGMPAYPFAQAGERPPSPSYRAYLNHYQTRSVGR